MKRSLSKNKLIIFCFLVATAFLGICSKSSPLYPMNDWVDVQCFLTLGEGILHGMAPYVDLYEQKGPLLYMLYAPVALLCGKGYFGQFLLEVITYGLFLYYSAKIAQLHLGESRLVYPIVAVLAGTAATAYAFCHGGSVEQMCLFVFVYGLYTVLKACKEDRGLSKKEAIVNGALAASLLWIKYTMLGFYIGLGIFILIWYLGWIRKPRELLVTIGRMMLGFAAITGVVLVFCLVTGSLGKMFECYFYNNLFLYPSESQEPLLEQIGDRFSLAMDKNEGFPFLLYLGIAYLLIRAKEWPKELLAVTLSFTGLVIFTFMGKSYPYYALTLAAFSVFGLIGIAKLIRKIPRKEIVPDAIARSKSAGANAIALVCILCLYDAHGKSSNVYLMDYEREDLPQYQFAEHIRKVEDATLLNFGFLDAGFYRTADVLPSTPFFCTFNVNAPGMWESQYAIIEEGAVDFVITRRYELSHYNCDGSKYELIDTASLIFEEFPFTYYLYALKETA